MRRCLALAIVVLWPLTIHAQVMPDPRFKVETLIGGILPTSMTFIGADDFLVCERTTGHVRRVTNDVMQAAPVLDLAVDGSVELGLLGITTDPRFLYNHYVYLYLTEADGVDGGTPLGNRVYR